MSAWKAAKRHQERAKFAPIDRTARAVAPRGVFLNRYQNFKMLHVALGSDVLLTATKTHIAKDRAERILAQEEVIDDQLAEHMGRMIRTPAWFDAEAAVIDNEFVDRIKSIRADDEDEAQHPAVETMMTAARLQPEVNDSADGGLAEQTPGPAPQPLVAAVAANADQRAAGPSRGVEDRYDLFAQWLAKQIAATPGLKSDISKWLGIELWMLNGWISARRRMFLDDVEMLSNALTNHGHAWGGLVRGKFDEFVIRQLPTTRGRTRRSQTGVPALVGAGAPVQASESPAGKPTSSPQTAVGAVGQSGKVQEAESSSLGVRGNAAKAGPPSAPAAANALAKGPAVPGRVPTPPAPSDVMAAGSVESVMADIVHTARSLATTLETAIAMLAEEKQRQAGKSR